jgi:hypothetical protein
MLVESLKQIINQFNLNIPVSTPLKGKWNFNYGKEYWQNLQECVFDGELPFLERQKYLWLYYVDRNFIINSAGAIQGYTFDGAMVLLVRSKISEKDYNYKYETHIKNIKAQSEKLFNSFSDCDGFLIKSWREIEVHDEFDTNMDGIKINFTIEFKY